MAATGNTLDNVVNELKSINSLVVNTASEQERLVNATNSNLRFLNSSVLETLNFLKSGMGIVDPNTSILESINTNILESLNISKSGTNPNTSILESMNISILSSLDILKDINSFQPDTSRLLGYLKVTTASTLNVLGNMLNLMVDDSAAAREAAREAARGAKGGGEDKGGVADAKVKEAKAGGFFSKLGMAVMNPMKALGSGLAKIGRGIEGLLTGIARGIMAFANPLVIIGVATLSISLPIFAAGLAAAFKVFDMIAGTGSALALVTGIIESLGKAIGTILHDVLVGFGKMIKFAGPGIKLFFDGLATVIKALAPIVTSFFKVIKDIITDPVLNKTIRAVLKVIEVAIKSVERVLIAFAPYIEKIMKVLGDVVVKVFKIIKDIITDPVLNKTIQQLLKTVEVVIKEIGKAIKVVGDIIITVVKNIGGIIESIGKAISDVITAIGDTVTKVIGAVADLIKTIGDTIVNIIDGVVSGIERLAALPAGNMLGVAAGMAAMAVSLAMFGVGAAVGAAFMPSRETLEGIAKSVETFGSIDSANLSAVGKGMTDIGVGLAVFGVGGALADLLKVEGGGLESIAKSVEMFGNIPSDNLATVGIGMEKVGVGLAAFGAGGFLADLLMPKNSSGLEAVATSVKMFGGIDATNFAMVGDGIKKLGVGLAAFGGGGAISALGDAFTGWISGGDKEDPVDKFKKFAEIGPGVKDAADGISGLAKAFDLFNDADPEKAGKAVNAFANSIDPAAIAKLKDSFAGLSSEALFKGGVYKLEPVLGQFETGGPVPATGTYKLHKDEMVIDNAAVTMLVQGAQAITAMQTGEELTGLQRESNQLTEGAGAPIVVNAPTTTSINQGGTAVTMLPASPITPGQNEIDSRLH